jgi:cholesterol oxidase
VGEGFSAGTLGTLQLLFRCRDITRSLPKLSPRLGEILRTNSEALLGGVSRNLKSDYSKGVAITSIFQPDGVTAVEPVRFPKGSSLLRYISAPLIGSGGGILVRVLRLIYNILRHPVDFLHTHVLPGWAQRTTILLVMQTEDNHYTCVWRYLFTLPQKAGHLHG